jgi:zinc protease
VTRRPTFPANEVELAKANTLQGLQAQEAQPSFQANRAFNAALFGNHPYRFVSITPEVVKAVTPEALRAIHAARFQPSQALLVISGDVHEASTMKLITSAFGDWKDTGDKLAPLPEAPVRSTHEFLLLPRPGSVQATLRVGRPAVAATHADYIPLQLANVILGGSFDSRIVRNIREDKGYTYSPGARAAGMQHGGSYSVRADVRTEVTAASLMEIFYEMDRMGTTVVGEDELLRAKRFMGGTYLFQNQMLRALTGTLATYWVNGLKPEAFSEFIPKVNAVPAEEVRRIGRTYFAAKDQTIVVVGDEAKAKAELAQFGPVKVLKN